MAVSWKDSFAVVDLGLWLMLFMIDAHLCETDNLFSVKLLAGTVSHLNRELENAVIGNAHAQV